ncbi:MAG: hypothetical protein H0V42_08715, partial [Nocardioidaceae bacterium]|nr:hypothetical protein [Nocardioidaceae bacterium]
SAVFLLRGFTLAALAVAAAWTLARDLYTRRAITRLAVDLAQAPRAGTLEADLAAALEDPDVEVAYWAPGTRRYLNGDGREVQPRALDGRSATPIVRHGEPVAVVVHSRSTVTADLEAVLGAATRLAVDNERLRAEILAQVEDLRASRARIVEAGDHARRSLERNLHDGAQQRLLALCYELRLARDQADRDSGRLAMLTLSCDEGQAALASLRELAHGIYPVVLADAGLGPALLSLAEDPEVPVPVELVGTVDRRFPEPVERAVYLFIVEAIDHVASTGSDHVEVSLVCDDDRVRVMVGPTSAMPGAEMSDRIGALGGTVDLHHGVLRAEVQCG